MLSVSSPALVSSNTLLYFIMFFLCRSSTWSHVIRCQLKGKLFRNYSVFPELHNIHRALLYTKPPSRHAHLAILTFLHMTLPKQGSHIAPFPDNGRRLNIFGRQVATDKSMSHKDKLNWIISKHNSVNFNLMKNDRTASVHATHVKIVQWQGSVRILAQAIIHWTVSWLHPWNLQTPESLIRSQRLHTRDLNWITYWAAAQRKSMWW